MVITPVKQQYQGITAGLGPGDAPLQNAAISFAFPQVDDIVGRVIYLQSVILRTEDIINALISCILVPNALSIVPDFSQYSSFLSYFKFRYHKTTDNNVAFVFFIMVAVMA
jgi:hypothetical protein